jgi:drug/metabolite transporter (DMT)-like permease
MPTDRRRGLTWALLSSFCIAAFVIPWKLANVDGDTSVNTLILLGSAAVFNSLLTGAQRRALPRFGRFDLIFAAWLAVLSLIGNLMSAEAILRISPSLLTVVQRSELIIVALLAWPLIGERVDGRFWLGAAIAISGVVYMQMPFGADEAGGLGVGFAVVSAACFGAMAVFTRKFIHRIDAVSINALRLWMSVALWFAFNGLPPELAEVSSSQLIYAALAAFFGPFVGRLCLMEASRHIEARTISLVVLLSPAMTLILAYLILGDLPSAKELQGSAIMLFGIGIPIVSRSRRR